MALAELDEKYFTKLEFTCNFLEHLFRGGFFSKTRTSRHPKKNGIHCISQKMLSEYFTKPRIEDQGAFFCILDLSFLLKTKNRSSLMRFLTKRNHPT